MKWDELRAFLDDADEITKRRILNRLRVMLVGELSTVDEGANRKRFLVVKSKEADMGTEGDKKEGDKLTIEDLGKLLGVDGGEDTKKAAKISNAAKEKAVAALKAVMERANTLAGVIEKLESTDEKLDKPVPAEVEKELKGIAALLTHVLEGSPAAPADKASEDEVGLEQIADVLSKAKVTELTRKDTTLLKKVVSSLIDMLKRISPDLLKEMNIKPIAKDADKKDGEDDKADGTPAPATTGEFAEMLGLMKQQGENLSEIAKMAEANSVAISKFGKTMMDGSSPPEGGPKKEQQKEVQWNEDLNAAVDERRQKRNAG